MNHSRSAAAGKCTGNLRRNGVVIFTIPERGGDPSSHFHGIRPRIEGGSLWSPLYMPGMSGFDRFWTYRFSLDENARKFLTTSVPTGRPDSATALVQQGLQPIAIKRERPNPSRRVKNFRQGLSRVGQGWRHSGRAFARGSTLPTRNPFPACSPARLATCWPRESVQSLSRIGGRQYLTRRRHIYATDRALAQAC